MEVVVMLVDVSGSPSATASVVAENIGSGS